MKFRQLCVTSLLVCLLGSVALAVEPLPQPVLLSVFQNSDTGVSSVLVQNQLNFPIGVVLNPGSLTTIQFVPIQLSLPAGGSQEIALDQFRFGQGRQILHMEAQVLDSDGRNMPGVRPVIYQPFLVDGKSLVTVSYEDAFLSHRVGLQGQSRNPGSDLGGGFIDHSPISPFQFVSRLLPAGATIIPSNNDDPLVMAQMPLKQLPNNIAPQQGSTCTQKKKHHHDDDAKRGGAKDDDDDSDEGHGRGNPCKVDDDRDEHHRRHHEVDGDRDHERSWKQDSRTLPLTARANVQPPPGDPIIQGNMSLFYPDGTFHAAWGWVTRAWQQVGPVWIMMGWSYVGGDGSWQINMPFVFPGQVFVEYRPANRFVQLQDGSGNVYAWGDWWALTGDVTDIGGRYADFSQNGDLPGVNTLYVGATDVWEKFYATGMNALRDEPIQVTFPNTLTSGHCIYNTDSNGNTVSTYAWSCSQTADGKIWLIAAHAQPFVVQHEIGHSINSYYWGGSMPSGAGGSHSLTGCYNNGLALAEGFADFIGYWTEFDRAETNPVAGYAGYNIETVDNNPCSGQTNETHVSATFWDMYDLWNDGPDPNTSFDSLLYTDPATSVAIYLNNSGKNSMGDYLGVVKNGQSTFWQGEFTKLFRLNTIIP